MLPASSNPAGRCVGGGGAGVATRGGGCSSSSSSGGGGGGGGGGDTNRSSRSRPKQGHRRVGSRESYASLLKSNASLRHVNPPASGGALPHSASLSPSMDISAMQMLTRGGGQSSHHNGLDDGVRRAGPQAGTTTSVGLRGREELAATAARRRREEMANAVVKRTQSLAATMVKNGYVPPGFRRGAGTHSTSASKLGSGGGATAGGGSHSKVSGHHGGAKRGTGKSKAAAGVAGSAGGRAGGGRRPSPEAVRAAQEKMRAEKCELFEKYRFGHGDPPPTVGTSSDHTPEEELRAGVDLLARPAGFEGISSPGPRRCGGGVATAAPADTSGLTTPPDTMSFAGGAPGAAGSTVDTLMQIETGWRFQRVNEANGHNHPSGGGVHT
jgi:hypothetical protein